MPTPTGKLKAADRLRHKKSGQYFTVLRRTGNDDSYGVVLRPDNPEEAKKFPGGNFILSEAQWHLSHDYELVEDSTVPKRVPEWVIAHINRYFKAVYGMDYVYRAPETFNAFEQWLIGVTLDKEDFAEERMTAIEDAYKESRT